MSTFEPHAYQEAAINHIIEKKQTLVLLDPGLGKTGICLEAATREPAMFPMLVVSPLRVATDTWPSEIRKFDFGHSFSVLHGANKLDRLLEKTKIKIINFEGLKWLSGVLKEKKRVPFRSIVIDESSRIKNPKSARFKLAAAIADHCEYRVCLTGTPTPQSYLDLWSQVFVIDRGEALGSLWDFIGDYFTRDYFKRPIINVFADKLIENKIQHLCLRGDARTLLDMPEKVEQTVSLYLPDDLSSRYQDVEFGFLGEADDLDDFSEANYAALRCFASGFLYHQNEDGTRETEAIHNIKIDALKDLHDEIGGKPLLVAFNYRGERESICEKFDCPYIDGTSKSAESSNLIKQWNAGELPMLAVHPLSVGHGLNLQAGGHHMLWYSLPDSGELYEQTVARLWRQGQGSTVYVYRFLVKDTIEENILGLLRKKMLTQSNLLQAIKKRLHNFRATA